MKHHSPEPWRVSLYLPKSLDGKLGKVGFANDADGHSVLRPEAKTENARRVVACVNAMKDVPDPAAFMRACKELLRNHSGGGILPPDSRTYISRLAEYIDIELPC